MHRKSPLDAQPTAFVSFLFITILMHIVLYCTHTDNRNINVGVWDMILFETISTVSVILFIAGIVLLLIELFVPGFGIFGGLGLIALVLCIVFQAKTLLEALILFLIISAIVVALALIAARSLRRGWLYRSSIVLKDAEEKEQGYVANQDRSHFVGKVGKSLTTLRPAGTALFDGEKVDVVTDGAFIPSGVSVEVVRIMGPSIIVRQLEDSN